MKSQEKLPRAMADYGKRFEQGLEQMSPFEIKNDLISYAKECDQKAVCQFLNAGRGNPNWINTVATLLRWLFLKRPTGKFLP
mgnify:CR=1 FL=1